MADVKQSHPRAFEELELRLKQLDGFQTKAGWFDAAKYDDGTPVAYIAAISGKGAWSHSAAALHAPGHDR
jgi:hypothetical protein